MKHLWILLYMACIVFSNVLTASLAPIHIGYFIIPYGTFLIGMMFVFRDFVQVYFGRRKTYVIISISMIVSALISLMLGDTLWIVFASAVTFILSESLDTEIFSRTKSSFKNKMLYSGLVGGSLDSLVFVLVGLSPLGANFVTWQFVGYAIAGQLIVKSALQFITYLIIKYTALVVNHENPNA